MAGAFYWSRAQPERFNRLALATDVCNNSESVFGASASNVLPQPPGSPHWAEEIP